MATVNDMNRRARLDNLMTGSSSDSQKATCECCGSTHFFSVTVEQYNKGYGSVEYTPMNSNPKPIKICVCGTPLPTKSTLKGATNQVRSIQEEFIRSLDCARTHVIANTAKELAKSVATTAEVQALEEKVKQLEEAVAALTSQGAKEDNHKTKK
jgi:hypothetical protein